MYNLNGAYATATRGSGGGAIGGAGGYGTVTIQELNPDLNCTEKSLVLDQNESYQINSGNFKYLNSNSAQEAVKTVGRLEYKSLDTNIATVNNTGKIIALKPRKNKN